MPAESSLPAPRRIVVDATACLSGGKVYVNELLPLLIECLPDTEWVVYGELTPELAGVAASGRVQFRNVHFPQPTTSLLMAGVSKLIWREIVLPLDVLLLRPCLLLSTSNFASPHFAFLKVPVLLAIHNLLPFHEPDWYREPTAVRRWRQRSLKRLTVLSAKRAAQVIAFSAYAKAVLCDNGVNDSHISVVHHGTWPARQHWRGEDSDTVLVVAHYFTYKNIDVVIRAFPQVQAAAGRPLKLLIQGISYDGTYYARLAELVRTLHLEGSVTLGRGVPSGELAALYAGCRCLVFPAIGENCPMTLLEAMSIGTPIVAAAAAPLPEICSDAAVYYDTFDEGACASAIAKVVNGAGTAKELSAAGRRQAGTSFTWEVCAQKTVAAIRRAWGR